MPLVVLPFFTRPCRDLLPPMPVYAVETTRDHVLRVFSKVCFLEALGRGAVLPESEQPVPWLCTWSPGQRVLLCSLRRTAILNSLTLRCLFYLFQEAQARGGGCGWSGHC